MIEPHGRFWIPPPLNTLAAQEEIDAEKSREDAILASQEERRKNCAVNTQQDGITTGAQMRRLNADNNGGAGVKLNQWERKVFHELLYEKLCASQESICETMAFAFDKSGAAHEISQLLLAAILESGNEISVDTRIARLFLLSDILFNSQQPGVKNAFHYRDAIEAMSPTVFESLGRHRGGRMTKNRLRKAVLSVLGAWANWSVYTTDFLDELESKFEGREIKVLSKDVSENFLDNNEESLNGEGDGTPPVPIHSTIENNAPAMSTSPQGTWTTANNNIDVQCSNNITTNGDTSDDDLDGESIDSIDGEEFDAVHDGEYVLDGVEQEKVA
jgi:U2-associated protein SR140